MRDVYDYRTDDNLGNTYERWIVITLPIPDYMLQKN